MNSNWRTNSASKGICVNEHHQNAYGNMPSPNIMAACLARRTQQAKLAILGNVLPLYDHPQRVAEELAMLDVITKGRVISGMVVGTGMEYFSYNINPTYARERFHEAHDLIVKAWTHRRAVSPGKASTTAFDILISGQSPIRSPIRPSGSPVLAVRRPWSGWHSSAIPTWCCRPSPPLSCGGRAPQYFRECCERERLYGAL